MGKNQSASNLTNVIQVSSTGNVLFVSGSTTLMSISSSGAITTTGVISGSNALSASYAANADTLDGLDSTVFTLTSSFNAQTASFTAFTASLNAFSASILAQTASLNSFSSSVLTFTGSAATRLGALESYTSSLNNKTASFATTGSNNFIGTQTISGSVLQSGSFTTTGTIIAQTINVQQVTSSVVYSSGSNIFGNLLGDSQTFTGSVLVTGSLTISTGGNVSAPTIFGSTIACSPIGCFATSCATAFIGGTMSGATIYGSTAVCSAVGKFTSCIDAGTGTFSGAVAITTALGLLVQASSEATIRLNNTGGGTEWRLNSYTNGNLYFQSAAGATNAVNFTPAGAATFSSTITGTTIYGSTAVCSANLVMSYGQVCIYANTAGIQDQLVLRNDNATAGTDGSSISFKGYQGNLAKITAYGIPQQQVGGYLQLQSYSDNTTANTGLIINQSGNVGIGTTTTYSTLTVGSGDSTAVISPGGSNTHLTLASLGASGAIRFYTIGGGTGVLATTESMRVAVGGNVGIGCTTPGYKLDVCGQLNVGGDSTINRWSGDSWGRYLQIDTGYQDSGGGIIFTKQSAANDQSRAILVNHGTFYIGRSYSNNTSCATIYDLTIASTGIACFACQVCAPIFRASNRLISNFTQIYNSDFTVSAGTSRSVVICGGILTTGDFHLMMYGNAGTGMGSIRFSTYGYFANSNLLGFCEHLRSAFGSAAISSVSNNGTSISFTIANCSVSNVISGNWRMISTVGDDVNQCLNVFVL